MITRVGPRGDYVVSDLKFWIEQHFLPFLAQLTMRRLNRINHTAKDGDDNLDPKLPVGYVNRGHRWLYVLRDSELVFV